MENMCKSDLMMLIQSTNFALIETSLYLDTHPDCPCGLEKYHEYRKKLLSAIAIYEKRFEPITIYGMCSDDYWTWGNEPWPWQKECE